MPGIEFRDDGDRPPGSEDVLDTGGQPRLPRWTYGLVALVVAALVAGVVTKLHGGAPTAPVAVPTSAPTDAPSAGPVSPVDDAPFVTADDTAIVGDYLFQLRPDALSRFRIARDGDLAGSVTLPLTSPDVQLSGGPYHLVADPPGNLVWVVGYGAEPTVIRRDHGAVLVRLDPRTLAPVRSSPLAAQLGPGALLVAAGSRVLWVRSGAGGDALWCVDAPAGAVEQHWKRDGIVASRHGAAYLDQFGQLRRLKLGGCRG